MQRKSDFIMMAVMILLSVSLVGSISISIGLATRNAKADYGLIVFRNEIEERLDRERKEYLESLDKLNKKMESDSYVNQRRYELLSDEITIINKNKK
jgi:uncharacterized protein YdaL